MTLLHQAAQKAVEALNAVRGDKSFCCLKEERTQAVVLAAIAQLSAALQHQEEPREPVADFDTWQQNPYTKVLMDSIKNDYMPRADAEALIRAAASPSTTRQQEVGSAPEGFRLLPVEATDAMMYADWDVTMSDAHSNGGVSAAAWRAMVEAAPQVTYGDGHSGVGWYMHDTDYPEEGAVFLGAAAPSTPEKAGGVSDGGKASPAPLHGIAANWYHGEGAIAQCCYCSRYSLDPRTLSDRQPVCECGQKHGWSGSFKKPGPDAKWSGKAPAASPSPIPHPLPAQANDGGEHG